MRPWQRRLLRGALYGLLFVVSVVFFLYVAFPWDRAARFAEAALAKKIDMDVRIGGLSPSRLTGIEFRDVVLRSRKPDRQGRLRTFAADRIVVRASLGTVLGGDTDVDFEARMMGGTIQGQIYRTRQDSRLVARLQGISPDQVTLLHDMVGLPIEGSLVGDIDLTLRDHKFGKASGSVEFVARGVIVGDGKARLRLKVRPQYAELQEFLDREDQGVALPPMKVGTFTMKLRVSGGTARVVQMGSSSEHIEIKGEGELGLQDPVTASEVGLYVMYRFTPAYENLDSETRSFLESMGRSPHYQRAKRSDGFYGFRLQGAIRDRIRALPARDNVPQVGPTAGPLVPSPDDPHDPPPPPIPPTIVGACLPQSGASRGRRTA